MSTNDLAEKIKFILKNIFFKFNDKIKQEKSGTAIGTIFARTYACLFMDDLENICLNKYKGRPLAWFW